jgi:hypothetical protein
MVIVQHVYNGDYIPMLNATRPWHQAYCNKHGLKYVSIVDGEVPNDGDWYKVRLIRDLLEEHNFIMWLDADAFIYDTNVSVTDVPLPEDSIGACHFPVPVPHWNVGVLYFKNGPRVKAFVEKWLQNYPGEGRWYEQEAFNRIGKDFIVTLPDVWNSSLDHNFKFNPVVRAFHGVPNRDKLIIDWMEKLNVTDR